MTLFSEALTGALSLTREIRFRQIPAGPEKPSTTVPVDSERRHLPDVREAAAKSNLILQFVSSLILKEPNKGLRLRQNSLIQIQDADGGIGWGAAIGDRNNACRQ
jgi:hypothetical protein